MSRKRRVCVIIPTYNEAENLGVLVPRIEKAFKASKVNGHVLIVDDSSPDGTADLASKLAKKYGNITVFVRPGKLGLGSAYREGFGIALNELKSDVIFEMDADLSHDPTVIPSFIRKIGKGYDVVVGSRHIPGGEIQGWSFFRYLVSGGANMFAKIMLGLQTHDVTSGYRAFTRDALTLIDYRSIGSEGYAFQIETLNRCYRFGLKVGEVPITFKDRRAGISKLGLAEIYSFIVSVLKLFYESVLG